MEPNEALRSVEIALRLLVREVLGASGWGSAPGAPNAEKLSERREEEQKRRDGSVAPDSLLEYTETFHLTELILKNWESFKPVFADLNRTRTFFGILEDVRNAIAHSRDLVPFERDLIAGVSGQLRNQIALYRGRPGTSTQYYPAIEAITDSFGIEAIGGLDSLDEYDFVRRTGIRLEVGDVIRFKGRAFNAGSLPTQWFISWASRTDFFHSRTVVALGDDVEFAYTVTEDDVSEKLTIMILITTESKYHRRNQEYGFGSYDDIRGFGYAVNPPLV